MDNLLTSVPVVNGKFYWFMGDKRVGWIAADDLAAVSAQVLAEGPQKLRANSIGCQRKQ
jgi:NAD(P)H dehydrogenase (quinone)